MDYVAACTSTRPTASCIAADRSTHDAHTHTHAHSPTQPPTPTPTHTRAGSIDILVYTDNVDEVPAEWWVARRAHAHAAGSPVVPMAAPCARCVVSYGRGLTACRRGGGAHRLAARLGTCGTACHCESRGNASWWLCWCVTCTGGRPRVFAYREDSDARNIKNAEVVSLRAFSTKVGRVRSSYSAVIV